MVDEEDCAFLLYRAKRKTVVDPVFEWTGNLVALNGSVVVVGAGGPVVLTVDKVGSVVALVEAGDRRGSGPCETEGGLKEGREEVGAVGDTEMGDGERTSTTRPTYAYTNCI